MVGDDAAGDRETEAGPGPTERFAGEEGFEEMLAHFVGHAATVIFDGESYFVLESFHAKPNNAIAIVIGEGIEGVGDKIEDDLFDFLWTGEDGELRFAEELDVAAAILTEVFDHFEHIDDQFAEVGGLAFLRLVEPREVEEAFGDSFDAEGFILDASEIISQGFDIGLIFIDPGGLEDAVDASFEGFSAPGDGGKWVIDFVGDAGGEKADARKLFVADDFAGTFLDLFVEATLDLEEAGRASIDGAGEFAELIIAIEFDLEFEISIGDASGAGHELFEGANDEASDVVPKPDEEDDGKGRGSPGHKDPTSVAASNFIANRGHALLES